MKSLNDSIADVCIVGGGAAGLVAAISAAEHNARVVLFETNDRVGKKLLSTGNGRCNLSNASLCSNNYNTHLVDKVYKEIGVKETLETFNRWGLFTRTVPDGRIFPYSNTATSLLDVLRHQIDQLGVTVLLNNRVNSIETGKHFRVSGVKAKTVIVCCGSLAGGGTNSYHLLTNLGHKKTSLYPALTRLSTDSKDINSVMGIKHQAPTHLFIDNKLIASSYGEVLFARDSLSGTPIFFLSRYASPWIGKKSLRISIDLFDALNLKELDKLLESRKSYVGQELLTGLVPKRLGLMVLKRAQAPNDIPRILKDLSFNITGGGEFQQAQIVVGGVRDFNLQTMESNRFRGLYAAGEMLDIDGDCGGYNLQWAWSSGIIAGKNAAKRAKQK